MNSFLQLFKSIIKEGPLAVVRSRRVGGVRRRVSLAHRTNKAGRSELVLEEGDHRGLACVMQVGSDALPDVEEVDEMR